jgi:hypothetical protein
MHLVPKIRQSLFTFLFVQNALDDRGEELRAFARKAFAANKAASQQG